MYGDKNLLLNALQFRSRATISKEFINHSTLVQEAESYLKKQNVLYTISEDEKKTIISM